MARFFPFAPPQNPSPSYPILLVVGRPPCRRLLPLSHQHVSPRRMDAHHRQYVDALDLRRQRRGPHGSLPLHHFLSFVRDRCRTSPLASQSAFHDPPSAPPEPSPESWARTCTFSRVRASSFSCRFFSSHFSLNCPRSLSRYFGCSRNSSAALCRSPILTRWAESPGGHT